MNTHEYLSFNKPISSAQVADRIRTYYAGWIARLNESTIGELKLKMTVNGESIDGISKVQGVLSKLAEAESFTIDMLATGLNDEDTENLYVFLDEFKSIEDITYKIMTFSEKYAKFKSRYIADGESGSLFNKAVENAALEDKLDWYCWSCNLWTEFDFEEEKAAIDKLYEIARKYLPQNLIADAEAEWTGENADPGALIPDLQWIVSDLKEVAGFSDEVNAVLKTLDGNYQIEADGLWFDLEQFAAAKWQVADNKLKLVSVKAQF